MVAVLLSTMQQHPSNKVHTVERVVEPRHTHLHPFTPLTHPHILLTHPHTPSHTLTRPHAPPHPLSPCKVIEESVIDMLWDVSSTSDGQARARTRPRARARETREGDPRREPGIGLGSHLKKSHFGQAHIISEDGVPLILRVMGVHEADDEVQKKALSMLWNLTISAAGSMRLVRLVVLSAAGRAACGSRRPRAGARWLSGLPSRARAAWALQCRPAARRSEAPPKGTALVTGTWPICVWPRRHLERRRAPGSRRRPRHHAEPRRLRRGAAKRARRAEEHLRRRRGPGSDPHLTRRAATPWHHSPAQRLRRDHRARARMPAQRELGRRAERNGTAPARGCNPVCC